MHLGAMGNTGAVGGGAVGGDPSVAVEGGINGSFLHVVLNNGLHESVGAQPT